MANVDPRATAPGCVPNNSMSEISNFVSLFITYKKNGSKKMTTINFSKMNTTIRTKIKTSIVLFECNASYATLHPLLSKIVSG